MDSNKHAFGIVGSDGSSSDLFITDDDSTQPYGVEVTGGSGTSLSPFTLAVLRECTASFDGGGAEGNGPEPLTVLSGGSITLPGCGFTPPTGKAFSGWLSSADESVYQPGDPVTLTALWAKGASISEGGESGQLPDGWTTSGDDYAWTVGSGDSSSSTGAHGGDKNFVASAMDPSEGTAWLITPEMDLSGSVSGTLDIWYINRPWSGDIDEFGVYYRVGGGEWEELFSTTEGHSSWTNLTFDLPDDALTADVQIGFKANSHYGYGVGLDDISLDAVAPHTHSWAYTAEGATITAICEGVAEGVCLEPSETLTIAAPEDLTADGQPKPATLSIVGNEAFTGEYAIVYKRGDTVLDGAPAKAGTYTASVTVEGATVEVEYTLATAAATVLSTNVTLGGELGLNFFLSVPDDAVAAGAKAVLDGPQCSVETSLAGLEKDDEGRYKLSYPVAAVWTDRDVTLTLVDGDGQTVPLLNPTGERIEGDAMTYSVYRYCKDALSDSSPLDEGWKAKVRATYTYCAYAVRWKYGTEVPEGVDQLPVVTADSDTVAAHKAVAEGTAPEGLTVTSFSLLLDSDTSLRLYFTCEHAGSLNVSVDGKAVEPVSAGKGGKYYVQVGPIGVAHLGDKHTVSFGGGYTVTLDALSYVYGALCDTGTEPAVVDVSTALWAYAAAFAEA